VAKKPQKVQKMLFC